MRPGLGSGSRTPSSSSHNTNSRSLGCLSLLEACFRLLKCPTHKARVSNKRASLSCSKLRKKSLRGRSTSRSRLRTSTHTWPSSLSSKCRARAACTSSPGFRRDTRPTRRSCRYGPVKKPRLLKSRALLRANTKLAMRHSCKKWMFRIWLTFWMATTKLSR